MAKVKVEVDRISRDQPELEYAYGVTRIATNNNGDLLLYQGRDFPSMGYTSGVWLTFEVTGEEEE